MESSLDKGKVDSPLPCWFRQCAKLTTDEVDRNLYRLLQPDPAVEVDTDRDPALRPYLYLYPYLELFLSLRTQSRYQDRSQDRRGLFLLPKWTWG